jgi:predicted N-acetyltransferase YhbS
MTRDWVIRYLQDGDEPGLLECLTAAFGKWPGRGIDVEPIAHLRWKLAGKFALDQHYVAESDSQIIGCQLILMRRLRAENALLTAAVLTDYAVHPDFRGRGVSRDLWTFKTDPARGASDLIVSITGHHIVRRQISTMGWSRELAHPIDLLERDVDGDLPPPRHSYGIREVGAFDERLNALWEEASGSFDLILERRMDWLNWRYADSRAGEFYIRLAEENGRLLGYSVLSVSRGRGFIADMLAHPERQDAVEGLVCDGVIRLRELGARTVRCWCPRLHVYRRALLEHGFRPRRPVERLGFGPREHVRIPVLDDPNARVHVMRGDTDVV